MTTNVTNVPWLKVKNFFEFVWEWLKHNWLVVVLFIGVIVAVIFGNNKMKSYDELLTEYQAQIAQSHHDLAALQAVQQQEQAQQQVINQQYNDVLTKIQQQYASALTSLSVEKRKELEDIIKATHNDPSLMAQQVNTLFGLPIYATPSESPVVLSPPPVGHP